MKNSDSIIDDIYVPTNGTTNYVLKHPNYFFENIIPLIDLIETYQGEGPNCGKKMVLTRFKRCNKSCPFCDTQKMMKNLEPKLYSLKDVSLLLKTSPNLMITGGEPTLDVRHVINSDTKEYTPTQLELTQLMAYYLNYQFLDIETNGYNIIQLLRNLTHFDYPAKGDINISWSPKFVDTNDYNANIETLKQILNVEKGYLVHGSEYKRMIRPIIKIVISDDLEEYKSFIYNAILTYKFDPYRVYLMPKGTTIDEINDSMKDVLKVASDLGCNISSRLHIIHNFS